MSGWRRSARATKSPFRDEARARLRAGAVIPIPQLRPASKGIPDYFNIRGGGSARLKEALGESGRP